MQISTAISNLPSRFKFYIGNPSVVAFVFSIRQFETQIYSGPSISMSREGINLLQLLAGSQPVNDE